MGLVACALGASLAPAQEDVTVSARVKVVDAEKHTETSRSNDVVVWLMPLDDPAKPHPFPAGPWKLTQHNKSFQPHVLVVPVGSVVQFPNRDPFFHNVFSLFDGKRFDLGLYEAGSSRNVSFDRAGISYIFCNIHAEMSAVVIALQTPYYGVSNAKGELLIHDVPPGRYTMHVWYETALPATLSAMTHEITVAPGRSTLGVLEVPGEQATTAHKNKYGMEYEPAQPSSPGYSQH